MSFTDVDSLIGLKKELLKTIEGKLSDRERSEALIDSHARRKPRPCGLTIHTSIGCALQCRYCYIYDMGFSATFAPYPLNGLQLAYALLNNPYFIPTIHGTYLAIGSISEPFHPAVKEKTFEYIEVFYNYLGNPTQFSTKFYISRPDAEKLSKISGKKISPLVTIVTLENSRELEPYAPSPEKRLEVIRNLGEAGLKPFLFMRPIIPGVTDLEYKTIIDKAREYGAVGVVAGSLRVSKRILRELRELNIDMKEIERRLRTPIEKMRKGVQYEIYTGDIKREIHKYAVKNGLVFFPSSCMANLYTHGLSCWRMIEYGIIGRGLPKPDHDEVSTFLEKHGYSAEVVDIKGSSIFVKLRYGRHDTVLLREMMIHRYKMCPRIKDAIKS